MAEDSNEKFTRERILWTHTWSPRLVSFKISRARGFRFTPGQFARLGVVKPGGGMVWRAYSMVSATWDDHLEFLSILVPGGAFTSVLAELGPGDEILVDKQAQGFFTTDRFADGRDLWMLAAGTGLAPYLTILQEPRTWERFERLLLVHSVREAADLAYREEISALRAHPLWEEHGHKLQYQPIVTREDSPGALNKRIPELFSDGSLVEALDCPLSPEARRLMICGSPQMVESTHKQLMKMGYRLSRLSAPAQLAVENAW